MCVGCASSTSDAPYWNTRAAARVPARIVAAFFSRGLLSHAAGFPLVSLLVQGARAAMSVALEIAVSFSQASPPHGGVTFDVLMSGNDRAASLCKFGVEPAVATRGRLREPLGRLHFYIFELAHPWGVRRAVRREQQSSAESALHMQE